MNITQRKITGLTVLVTLVLFVGFLPARLAGTATAQTNPAIDENIVAKVVPAVVQVGPIVQVTDVHGDKKVIYLGWGSGTIISPDGFILTNRNVSDLSSFIDLVKSQPGVQVMAGKLAVFTAPDPDSPPVPSYIAEVAAESEQYDLAVLQITQDVTGKSVDGSSLGLPYLHLGDSSKLKLAQKLSIFGYPAAEGETITLTPDDVSGFTFETGVTGRAWVKISTSVSGGNRGGAAVDDSGNLVGVPAEAGDVGTDCTGVRDTNGDGIVDKKDVCVPLGGTITALRPVNLAKDLIDQAMNGVSPNPNPTSAPSPTETAVPVTTATPGAGAIETPVIPTLPGSISRLFFAGGVADNGYDPINIVTRLPSGSNSLVMYFDYKDFEDGVTFQPRIFLNGKEEQDAFPADAWDVQQFGSYGTYWFGYLDSEEPLADGTYVFQVDYDGRVLDKATIEIGGPPIDSPLCSDVTLTGGGVTGSPLPAGIDNIDASCDASNMGSVKTIAARWLTEDDKGTWKALATHNSNWTSGAKGTVKDSLPSPDGLQAGYYRVEFLNGRDLLATADVYLSGDNNGGTDGQFGPITFSDQVDENYAFTNPGTQFPSGTYKLYAAWDYHNMTTGTPYNVTWKINGEVSNNDDYSWDTVPDGTVTNYYLRMQDDSALPDGTYELDLSIHGTQVQTATAVLGSGEPGPTPSPTVSPDQTVNISGTIKDAVTGKPIVGAVFMVLNEDVTWSDYKNLQSQVLGSATTDRSGAFSLDTPLEYGHSYSMGVFADGYKTITEDGVEITTDLPSDLVVPITMQKGF